MKLLYITNGINGSGGLERVLSIKTSMLAEDYGYEVAILVLNNAHQAPFYTFSPKLKFYSVPVEGKFIAYYRAYKKGIQGVVDKVQPDVISVCDDGLKGFFLPRLVKTKAKWVYERHASIVLNTDSGIKGRAMAWLMRQAAKKFDCFVVLTPSNIEEWKLDKITAIPNPIGFLSDDTSTLDNKKVIAVGTHSFNKGYDLLLKSWVILEQQYQDWELHIYGKIDEEQTFIKMSDKMGLEKVYFHQPVVNIREKYLESSIMVLSSRSEGFGMVLIEAMACGLPCVSFDCPSGPRDIISNGKDGFLVKPEDWKSFAGHVGLLMGDDKLRKQMRAGARDKANNYETGAIVRRWNGLFNRLVV